MSHEFTLELVDGQILLDGRAVASLVQDVGELIVIEVGELIRDDTAVSLGNV